MARLTEEQVYKLALAQAKDIAPAYDVDAVALARAMTALAFVESGYNPDAKNKKSSARGLMQMLSGTQKYIEHDFLEIPNNPSKIYDPSYALLLAGTYLAYQYGRYGNDWKKAAHAYNQGSFPGSHKSDGANYAQKFAIAINSQTAAKNYADSGTTKFSLEFL